MSVKFSICFLFLVVLVTPSFSPFFCNAQNNSSGCKFDYRYVLKFDAVTGNWYWGWDYVPVCDPASTKTTLKANAPSAEIQKIWVDHNTSDDDVPGMRIHLAFDALKLKEVKCSAIVYFHYASGTALKGENAKFETSDGSVAVRREFTPRYESSTFRDFQLFMPYDALHINTHGKHDLKFDATVFCPDVGFLASRPYLFSYSRGK